MCWAFTPDPSWRHLVLLHSPQGPLPNFWCSLVSVHRLFFRGSRNIAYEAGSQKVLRQNSSSHVVGSRLQRAVFYQSVSSITDGSSRHLRVKLLSTAIVTPVHSKAFCLDRGLELYLEDVRKHFLDFCWSGLHVLYEPWLRTKVTVPVEWK